MNKENKYFFVSYQKEISDVLKLANIIKKDEWMDGKTTIVTCCPDYSSIPCQIINHKLSHLNNNELYESISMEIPYPTMSQVWNREKSEFQLFDVYLKEWTEKYLHTSLKYLFIDGATLTGKNFSKIKAAIKQRVFDYRFASVYLEKSSIFHPDYFVQNFSQEKDGGLLFEWENADNPNWNY